jgi:hypothetical protein
MVNKVAVRICAGGLYRPCKDETPDEDSDEAAAYRMYMLFGGACRQHVHPMFQSGIRHLSEFQSLSQHLPRKYHGNNKLNNISLDT